MSINKKPKDILEEIQSIFEDIKKNTGWESTRLPSDIKIEIGKAPEFHEDFGVLRDKKKIIFGDWIDKVEPKAIRTHFWEFLIIRESFTFFFTENLLFNEISQLVSFLLNLLALSYLHMKDPKSAKDIKFVPIRGRILFLRDEISNDDKELVSKIDSLIAIVNQGTSYKMIYNSFMNFIEDLSFDDIDQIDVIDDIRRYLSHKPEEIAAPIYLKENTTDVLLSLIDLGFNASSLTIAEKLNLNQSTVARQITKISSKFNTKWRLERNFFKLGLQTYLLIIRIPLNNEKLLNSISDELLKIRYIYQYFEGKNNEFFFQYTVFSCPNVISERISRKLEKMQGNGKIDSFELKIVKDRIFKTTIVNNRFKPSKNNFIKMLNNEIPSNKVILWDSSHHKDVEQDFLDRSDIGLLKFLSIIISKKISKFGLFGAHYTEYINFMKRNSLDLNNVSEVVNFLNLLQNKAFEKNLFNYRLYISLTGTDRSYLTIFRIECDPKSDVILNIIEKISIFSWILVVKALDEIYFLVLGPNYNHFTIQLIKDILLQNKLQNEVFSVKNKIHRYVAYDELYDFNSQKWSLF